MSLLTVFAAMLLSLSCERNAENTGDADMSLEIIKIMPDGDLNPYRQFEILFRIENNTTEIMRIPDLDQMECEFKKDDGAYVFRQCLKPPDSLELICVKASEKSNEEPPYPVSIKPGVIEERIFRSYDAVPVFPAGSYHVSMRVELEGGKVLESKPFALQVAEIKSFFEQELTYGPAPFTDTEFRQKLLVVEQEGEKHVILLASIYPEFLSVAADEKLDDSVKGVSLVYYWPSDYVSHLVCMVKEDKVEICLADKVPIDPVGKLKLHDVISLSGKVDFVGLAHVEVDENQIGIDDYILVTQSMEEGQSVIRAEYWLRNEEEDTFSRAEVANYSLPGGQVGQKQAQLEYVEEGFSVNFGDDKSFMLLPLEERLAEYRQKAGADANPMKNPVKR